MKVFVDLDHTLCIPNEDYGTSVDRYKYAAPVISVIKRVQWLYNSGHHITIYTARRMKTCKGDVEAVEREVGEITRDWLKKYGVPYDVLMFGKPYYDLLIDDNTMTPEQFLKSNLVG